MEPSKANIVGRTVGGIIGCITTVAIVVGVGLPPNSTAQKICVGIVVVNIFLVGLIWLIAKVRVYTLYPKWKAEQEKQERKQTSKKKGNEK